MIHQNIPAQTVSADFSTYLSYLLGVVFKLVTFCVDCYFKIVDYQKIAPESH